MTAHWPALDSRAMGLPADYLAHPLIVQMSKVRQTEAQELPEVTGE